MRDQNRRRKIVYYGIEQDRMKWDRLGYKGIGYDMTEFDGI